MDRVEELARKNAAVIFTKSSCCMCHSIKTLFYDLGASPAIHELDKDARGREMEWALRRIGCNPSVPAVQSHLVLALPWKKSPIASTANVVYYHKAPYHVKSSIVEGAVAVCILIHPCKQLYREQFQPHGHGRWRGGIEQVGGRAHKESEPPKEAISFSPSFCLGIQRR
ncbi:Glutaredoxin-C11 [Vitis vinifera]|uniref:Glutaredoxin-C11 n=1 Tax=Vitis vinifera TaxID=29760 RepID=A0A438KI76_VITVI|nr:Glutaredoxin-C11 [Vitis vinifera]